MGEPSERGCVNRLSTGALLAFLICGPLFLFFPQVDSDVAAAFFKYGGGFTGNDLAAIAVLRSVFKIIYIAACALAVFGVVCGSATRARILWLTRWQHLFLITCLAVGPGLITNITFKDNWGRARPRDVVEFGGHKTFTPALVPARQCQKNCSFVSGEASSMFMVFFALALLLPVYSSTLVAAGLLTGLGAGAVRISQGAHFLSDVLFAGIFMALTAVLVYRLFQWLDHEQVEGGIA